jgi:hypothetical protein
MELRLPGLRPINQNIDPSEHSLVGDRRRDAAIMFDVAVEFDALLTHPLVSHMRVPRFNKFRSMRTAETASAQRACSAKP